MNGQEHQSHHSKLLDLLPHNEATHVAVKNGAWFDPGTWSTGTVPGANAKVVIPQNFTVLYNSQSDASLHTVRVDGTLEFATNAKSKMVVDTLFTSMGSKLIAGTKDKPMADNASVDIVIADNGPIDTNWDPAQLSRGVVTMGEVEMHGEVKTVHLKVSDDPMAGDKVLTLSSAVNNWEVGDTIVIAGTHHVDYAANGRRATQDEERIITSVNGNKVTLDRALTYNHDTPADDLYTSVANYTRNITISTENADDLPANQRGHTMFMHNADVDVRYVEFHELGRTDKSERLDDFKLTPVNRSNANVTIDYARVDENGDRVPDAGEMTNIRGRYAVHFHEAGNMASDDAGYMEGNAVIGSPGWGFVNHDSNADFVNNAAYNVFGAAFVGETGNEVGKMTGNISIYNEGTSDQYKTFTDNRAAFHGEMNQDMGYAGFGYWFNGRMIELEDNISAGAGEAGFSWMMRGVDSKSPLAINVADPLMARGHDLINHHDDATITTFDNNEAIAAWKGVLIDGMGVAKNHDGFNHLDNFTGWALRNSGLEISYSSKYIVDNFRLLSETKGWDSFNDGIRIAVGTESVFIKDSEVVDFRRGVYNANHTNVSKGDQEVYDRDINLIDTEIRGNFSQTLFNATTRNGPVKVWNSDNLPGHELDLQFKDWSLRFTNDPAEIRAQFPFFGTSVQHYKKLPGLKVLGTKYDSMGVTTYPSSNEIARFDEIGVNNILARDGFYTLKNGQRVVVLGEMITDRITGATKSEYFVTLLPNWWRYDGNEQNLGAYTHYADVHRPSFINASDIPNYSNLTYEDIHQPQPPAAPAMPDHNHTGMDHGGMDTGAHTPVEETPVEEAPATPTGTGSAPATAEPTPDTSTPDSGHTNHTPPHTDHTPTHNTQTVEPEVELSYGHRIDTSNIDYDYVSGTVGIDVDGNGVIDDVFSIAGHNAGLHFLISHDARETVISFHERPAAFSESKALDAEQINGIVAESFLTSDDTNGFTLDVMSASGARFSNTLGVYEYDASGAISNARILVANVKTVSGPLDLPAPQAGQTLGFFLVPDGANRLPAGALSGENIDLKIINGHFTLTHNGSVLPEVVFGTHDASFNPDGEEHVVSGADPGNSGGLIIGFEDQWRGTGRSDDDFQDLVLLVRAQLDPDPVDNRDLTQTPSDSIIAGTYFNDTNANGIKDHGETGIEGARVQVWNFTNETLYDTYTDANGNYSFADLPSGTYHARFKPLDHMEFVTGPISSGVQGVWSGGTAFSEVFELTGFQSVTGIDAGVRSTANAPKAVVEGTYFEDLNGNGLQSANEVGIEGARVHLWDHTTETLHDTYTDANGDYRFENLSAGSYHVRFLPHEDNDFVLASDIDGVWTGGTAYTERFSLGSSQRISDIDVGVRDTTTSGVHGGFYRDFNGNGVQNTGESSIAGAGVQLWNVGTRELLNTTTNAQGRYSFEELAGGTYQVRFVQQPGMDFVANASSDLAGVWSSGMAYSDTFTLATGQSKWGVDAGVRAEGSAAPAPTPTPTALVSSSNDEGSAGVRGGYYRDFNGNGVQNTGESSVSGAGVQLWNVNTNELLTTTTNFQGRYAFDDLDAGTYHVRFLQQPGMDFVTSAASDLAGVWPGGTAYSHSFTLADGQTRWGVDAGIRAESSPAPTPTPTPVVSDEGSAGVRGGFYRDFNGNGVQNTGESSVSGAGVQLWNLDTDELLSTTTNAQGRYAFNDLDAGRYHVRFLQEAGMDFVMNSAGDLAGVWAGGTAYSDTFTLADGQTRWGVDAGVRAESASTPAPAPTPTPTVSDDASGGVRGGFYRDFNGNGVQNTGESSVSGAKVYLWNSDTQTQLTTTTNWQGRYAFEDLAAGTYQVRFSAQNGLDFVTGPAASDIAGVWSAGMGYTDTFTLAAGQTRWGVDAGVRADTPIPSALVQSSAGSAEDPLDVLFVGSSFTFFRPGGELDMTVPAQFQAMAEAAGISVTYGSSYMGGASLTQQWGATGANSARSQLQNGDYDLVVLQDGLFDNRQVDTNITNFANLAESVGTEVLVTTAWAGDWVISLSEGDKWGQAFHTPNAATAAKNDAGLSPVSLAYTRVHEVLSARYGNGDDGQRAEVMLTEDAIHPSEMGAYLAANMIYAAAFDQKAPSASAYLPDHVSAADAAMIQDIVWDTYTEFGEAANSSWM